MTGLFLHKVIGDAMEPDLRSRDYVLCAPCDRYSYERMYVLDDGGLFWASRCPVPSADTVWIWCSNPRYGRHEVSQAWFNANVRGAVVAEVNVKVTSAELAAIMGRGDLEAAPLALAAA